MKGRSLALVGGPIAVALPAQAHLVTTGLGPLYDGITHLVVSPSDLLAVIALALLAGLGGSERGRAVLAVLPATWLAAGLVGLLAPREILAPVLSASLLLALGLLVALDRPLSRTTAAVVAGLSGLLLGSLNGTALAEAGGGPLALIGIVAAVTAASFLLAAAAVSARRAWQRIVVRVAGSWIAAVALLMVGWSLRLALEVSP